MNKSLWVGAVLGAAVVTAGGAAAYSLAERQPQFAEVLAVDPVRKTIETPREVCQGVAVTRQRPVRDTDRLAGTAVGAVVGGLLGSQIGGGNGQRIATVAGAIGGGYAGNQVQGRMQAGNTYTVTEKRCETVIDRHEEIIGYDVSYEQGGKQGQVRMDRDPGPRIPLQGGQLLLTQQ